jgi:putative membrane protein
MRVLLWLVRVVIFFALFAFALNNQHDAAVHWFFGQQWRAPMVIIVLAAFSLGCAFGVLAMVPSWWHHRRAARHHTGGESPLQVETANTVTPPDSVLQQPPRDGL